MRYSSLLILLSYTVTSAFEEPALTKEATSKDILVYIDYIKGKADYYGREEFNKKMDVYNNSNGKHHRIHDKMGEIKNLEQAMATIQKIIETHEYIIREGQFSEGATRYFKRKIEENKKSQENYRERIRVLTIEVLNPTNRYLDALIQQKIDMGC